MGQDIESFVEQQRDDGGWAQVDWPSGADWHTGPFMWLRSAELFTWLGYGDMDEVPSVDHGYGLPDDVSETVGALFPRTGEPEVNSGLRMHWATVDALLDGAYEGMNGGIVRELSVLAELNRARPTRILYHIW